MESAGYGGGFVRDVWQHYAETSAATALRTRVGSGKERFNICMPEFFGTDAESTREFFRRNAPAIAVGADMAWAMASAATAWLSLTYCGHTPMRTSAVGSQIFIDTGAFGPRWQADHRGTAGVEALVDLG